MKEACEIALGVWNSNRILSQNCSLGQGEVGTPMRMTQILCLFVIIPLVVRKLGERKALYIACAGRAIGYGVFQGLSALPAFPVRVQQVMWVIGGCEFLVGQATSPICRAIASRTAGEHEQGIVLGALGIAGT